MKTKILIILAFTLYILSGCTTYKAAMSEASHNPIAQKLPKMDIEFYSGGEIVGANVDFVKNIVRNEINTNIISSNGKKNGSIEVNCEKIRLNQNLFLPFMSGFTLFSLNLFGMPITVTRVEMELSFNIMNDNNEVIESYKYSTKQRRALGFYYGKDASVCMVEATKDIMKQFREDVNLQSSNITAKLNESKVEPQQVQYAQNDDSRYNKNTKKASAQSKQNNSNKNIEVLQSDVDQNIPTSTMRNDNVYALIIANEEYQFLDNVNFASHDGEVFKEYCIKTLGIPERQIRFCPNASYGIISGGVDWLSYALNNFEGSRAIVYYCGHGIPDEKTGEAYIIPVDGKGTNTATCYSLNQLYKTLSNTKAANVTYFMDACFTGANKEGSMLVAARGVAREPKKESIDGNTVVFSASSGDETAMTYEEKGHGLFTYYLLKKLQETGGDVSYYELAAYINRNVKKDAFLLNEKPQTPVVAVSHDAVPTWKGMKLK